MTRSVVTVPAASIAGRSRTAPPAVQSKAANAKHSATMTRDRNNSRCAGIMPHDTMKNARRVSRRACAAERTARQTGSELAMITGDQIRQARKLLGWHRGQIAIRARGITGNTVGKAEGAYPGKPPTPEQLAEIRAVLEAAGVEFTDCDPAGVRLKSPAPRRAL